MPPYCSGRTINTPPDVEYGSEYLHQGGELFNIRGKRGYAEACQDLGMKATNFYADVVTALGGGFSGGMAPATAAGAQSGAAFAALGPVNGIMGTRHAALAGTVRYYITTKIEDYIRCGYKTRQEYLQANKNTDWPRKDVYERAASSLADHMASMLILHSVDRNLPAISNAMLTSSADCMTRITTENTRAAFIEWKGVV